MNTVQLSLPFNPPLTIQRRPSERRSERLTSSRHSVREFRSLGNADEFIRLAREFANEQHEPFDELMTRVTLGQIVNNKTRDYQNLFVVYHYDHAVGFLLASIGHLMYADAKVAHQNLLYVTPSSRGSQAVLALMQAYEDWATNRGASLSFTGSNVEWSAEKTGRVFAKLGYRQIGVTFVKELRYGKE